MTDASQASDPSGEGGVSRPGGQGSKIYALSSEPKQQKYFCPGARPSGKKNAHKPFNT